MARRSLKWLLAVVILASAGSIGLATDGLPLSEVYGTPRACDLLFSSGESAIATADAGEGDVLLVTPEKVLGPTLDCAPLRGSRTQFTCRIQGKVSMTEINLSTSGAGTLSITIADKRHVLDRCPLKSSSKDVFRTKIDGRKILVLSGEIDWQDVQALKADLAEETPELVVLDSPGGLIEAAMEIGNEIRAYKLDTMVRSGQMCASACGLIFFSGHQKFLSRNGLVGLHQAHDGKGNTVELGTARVDGYLRAMGVPRSVLDRMYRFGPDDMMWLNAEDSETLRLVNLWP